MARKTTAVTAMLAALIVVPGPGLAQEESDEPSPLVDWAVVAGGQFAYRGLAGALGATGSLDLETLERKGRYSFDQLWRNVRDPFGSPKSDFECLPCASNEWGHYVAWGGMGAAASLRGHGPLEAWLITGFGSNVWWEYVVEGFAQRPSGHDLLINAGSAAVGVGIGEAIKALF